MPGSGSNRARTPCGAIVRLGIAHHTAPVARDRPLPDADPITGNVETREIILRDGLDPQARHFGRCLLSELAE